MSLNDWFTAWRQRFSRPGNKRRLPSKQRLRLTCELLEPRLAPANVLTLSDPNALTDGAFGVSVASSDGCVLVGSAGGAAHLYDASGKLLRTFTDPAGTPSDHFGTSVALSGNRVLIDQERGRSSNGGNDRQRSWPRRQEKGKKVESRGGATV